MYQPCRRLKARREKVQPFHLANLLFHHSNMADTKTPLEPPPKYEDAPTQHGAISAPMAKPLPRGPFPLEIPVLTQLRGKRVVLASASPRRKQLLGQACVSTPITPITPFPPVSFAPSPVFQAPPARPNQPTNPHLTRSPDRANEPRNHAFDEAREPLQGRPRRL
jgi:hypothetical protein